MQLKKFLSVIMAVAVLTAVIPLGTFTISVNAQSGTAVADAVAHQIETYSFPTLPYPITKDLNGEYKTDIFETKSANTYTHYYVDGVNGLDTNNGTTENTPVATLKKALILALNKEAYIHITSNSVFWDDGLYGEFSVKKNTIIDGNGCTAIWGVQEPQWTLYQGNVYISKDLTSQKCGAVVEISDDNKDMYGLYKGYKPASSIANLTAGTYYYDAENNYMYVYPRINSNINDIYPLRTSYGLRWNFATAPSNAFLYMRGVNYIGNHFCGSRSSSFPQTDKILELFYDNCKLSHCFSTDMVGISHFDNVYLIDCIAGYSVADIYNHHGASLSSTAKAQAVYVNMNCKATEAGWYQTNSSVSNCNLFTAHDGLNILRLNCGGTNSQGPLLADVNGCRSVNFNINVFNNAYSETAVTACIHFNNEQATQDGFITLSNVNVGDIVHSNCHKMYTSCKAEIIGGNILDDIVVSGSGKIVVNIYSFCTVCGKEEKRSASALGHNYINVVDEKYHISDADCTHATIYHKSCSCCGAVSEAMFTIGNPLGHDYINLIDDKYLKIAADCTHAAVYYKICSRCADKSSEMFESGEPLGHTAGEWVKDTEKHWHICSDCGERLDEANHTESDWITDKEALPGITGERHKECTVCGHVTETEIIPALAAYKPGDINNDGEVDNKDLTRLFQYLSNWDVTVNEAALDVNGDSSVDNKDLTRLFQYLSNWDVEIF